MFEISENFDENFNTFHAHLDFPERNIFSIDFFSIQNIYQVSLTHKFLQHALLTQIREGENHSRTRRISFFRFKLAILYWLSRLDATFHLVTETIIFEHVLQKPKAPNSHPKCNKTKVFFVASSTPELKRLVFLLTRSHRLPDSALITLKKWLLKQSDFSDKNKAMKLISLKYSRDNFVSRWFTIFACM